MSRQIHIIYIVVSLVTMLQTVGKELCHAQPLLMTPRLADYVDPRIGSEGTGRVVVGPSCPFGMVKPSPDCTVNYNSGWAPMPVQVDGFSQTHVSGTGGGPKYGNVLIMPFCSRYAPDYRETEDIRLGYYAAHLQSGIDVEVTAAERASIYRLHYPADSVRSLRVDAGWFLGEKSIPDARETQQFVGSEVEVRSDHEVSGYTRIRGGWNNGRAYTVYFWLSADQSFVASLTQHDGRERADLTFVAGVSAQDAAAPVHVKIGISFVSERQARRNAEQYIMAWNFDDVHERCLQSWESLLSRIEIDAHATAAQKRMFYTALYHTMLEPVDRTGDNPLWTDYAADGSMVPYYDDFYAIWDTYRTSSPLITLIAPQRQVSIIRSLLNICHRDGYMPDARSGNCNGRTQGGSNAEIVIADAFVKGLGRSEGQTAADTIDYEDALRCMLVDATLPPGGNQEAEGRGGLTEYLRLGYVPYGIDRSGTRTVEYAFCDYAIAEVASGLGYHSVAQQYRQQSHNWRNLWRSDYRHAGVSGFIMPRAADGAWLDTLVVGHSHNLRPTFVYTPVMNESPWYCKWWGTVFYEATSWEYSLSVPHEVPQLITQCGGADAFGHRLDVFFDSAFYNVNNEPSFLSPCLYHWIGRPDRTSDRVQQIVSAHYDDTPDGLPGNDDSGAMSSWLAFHMMGIYPNAGMPYYLIHTPMLAQTTLHLAGGRDFSIVARGLTAERRYIRAARLNGRDYPWSTIAHQQLLEGGTLELIMDTKPGDWGKEMLP